MLKKMNSPMIWLRPFMEVSAFSAYLVYFDV